MGKVACLTKLAVLAQIFMLLDRSGVRWVPRCTTDSVKRSCLPCKQTPTLLL